MQGCGGAVDDERLDYILQIAGSHMVGDRHHTAAVMNGATNEFGGRQNADTEEGVRVEVVYFLCSGHITLEHILGHHPDGRAGPSYCIFCGRAAINPILASAFCTT